MKLSAVELLRYASNLSVFVPLLIYFFRLSRQPRSNHFIGILLVCSAAADFVGFYLYSKSQSTAIPFNLYYMSFFVCGSLFYYEVIFKNHQHRYFYSGLIAYAVAFILVTVFIHDITGFQSEMWAITAVILVVFGILHTNHPLSYLSTRDKNLFSHFLISGGIFFYFSLNFFLFCISNYVLTEMTPDIARMTWAFHNVNNIVKNIAFAAGMFYAGRVKTDLTPPDELARWKHIQH
jgi:hypothetical protein